MSCKERKYNLVIYDTSNFLDFPIGGQLTSVRNFLKYMVHDRKEECSQVLLVGIASNPEEVGQICKLEIDSVKFDFLPVLYRNKDLACVKKSLRVEYLKALIKYDKKISAEKSAIHYVHTPEAFLSIKMRNPMRKTVVFSHGSFFNMISSFRFYKNNRLITGGFQVFLKWLLRKADLIFTLDGQSAKEYLKYNSNVIRVENSIVLPTEIPDRRAIHEPLRLLFVGRLSKVKRINEIIDAVELMKKQVVLTIVGDGEEKKLLKSLVKEKGLEEHVTFVGAVAPDQVSDFLKKHDILIMNSALEGKPMTILEAISYGLPVVTTKAGGIAEILKAHETAEFTDGTKEQIVSAVMTVAERYTQYVEHAVALARNYDYRLVNRKIYENIEKIRK